MTNVESKKLRVGDVVKAKFGEFVKPGSSKMKYWTGNGIVLSTRNDLTELIHVLPFSKLGIEAYEIPQQCVEPKHLIKLCYRIDRQCHNN